MRDVGVEQGCGYRAACVKELHWENNEGET